jgi:hypothetical protein
MLRFNSTLLFARKFWVVLAFSLVLTLVHDTIIHATTLTPSGMVPPTPLLPSGTLDATISGTLTTPTFSANFTEWVYSDPMNTFCVGCLNFVYQFTDLGPDALGRFTMSNFAGFNLDVGTNPFGVHDPMVIDRSPLGNVVGFDYLGGDEIASETTPKLLIETNARNFDAKGFLSAQGSTATFGSAFEPTSAATPEPSTFGLMGSGLLVLGGTWRRLRFRMRSKEGSC